MRVFCKTSNPLNPYTIFLKAKKPKQNEANVLLISESGYMPAISVVR